jgi:hypothetical protein
MGTMPMIGCGRKNCCAERPRKKPKIGISVASSQASQIGSSLVLDSPERLMSPFLKASEQFAIRIARLFVGLIGRGAISIPKIRFRASWHLADVTGMRFVSSEACISEEIHSRRRDHRFAAHRYLRRTSWCPRVSRLQSGRRRTCRGHRCSRPTHPRPGTRRCLRCPAEFRAGPRGQLRDTVRALNCRPGCRRSWGYP